MNNRDPFSQRRRKSIQRLVLCLLLSWALNHLSRDCRSALCFDILVIARIESTGWCDEPTASMAAGPKTSETVNRPWFRSHSFPEKYNWILPRWIAFFALVRCFRGRKKATTFHFWKLLLQKQRGHLAVGAWQLSPTSGTSLRGQHLRKWMRRNVP